MGFIYSIKISLGMKDEFSEAETLSLFCVAMRLLCVKSYKAYGLVLLGHLVISFETSLLFCHLSPTLTYPILLWTPAQEWGAEEEGPADRMRNAVLGRGAERREDLRQWRGGHTHLWSEQADGWQQAAAAPQQPVQVRLRGTPTYLLYTREQARTMTGVSRTGPVDGPKLNAAEWIQMLYYINVTFHLEHKVLFSLNCFHTFKCHLMHKKMALLKGFKMFYSVCCMKCCII